MAPRAEPDECYRFPAVREREVERHVLFSSISQCYFSSRKRLRCDAAMKAVTCFSNSMSLVFEHASRSKRDPRAGIIVTLKDLIHLGVQGPNTFNVYWIIVRIVHFMVLFESWIITDGILSTVPCLTWYGNNHQKAFIVFVSEPRQSANCLNDISVAIPNNAWSTSNISGSLFLLHGAVQPCLLCFWYSAARIVQSRHR